MRMHLFAGMSALAAVAAMAAETGSGSGTGAPKSADEVKPVEPAPKPPKEKAAATKRSPPTEPQAKGKRAFMVWVQPGIEAVGVGQLITTPPDYAETLRGVGRARPASEAEIERASADKLDVPHYETV